MILTSILRKKSISLTDEFLNQPIEDATYVVMDTELTGLDPKVDSIVSIGCIKMTGSKINIGQTFYRVVKPETALTSKSVIIHGITPSEAERSPSIEDIISDFLDFCGSSIVVGHFLFIDMTFLNKEFMRIYYGRRIGNPLVDTLKIYKWLKGHGDAGRHFFMDNGREDLFYIAKKYKIPVTDAHNALMDAFITAQLFQRFLIFLPELGVKRIKDLLKIGKP